jgi:hypothetical protein
MLLYVTYFLELYICFLFYITTFTFMNGGGSFSAEVHSIYKHANRIEILQPTWCTIFFIQQ